MPRAKKDRPPSEPPLFGGFPRPERNYFWMPTVWIDICARIDSLAELKVVQYVLRHTWGYQEYGIKKRITIDEFISGRRRRDGSRIDSGTGLSEQSVRNGLKSALQHGWIEEEVDDSDRGRIKKYYGLRMLPRSVGDDPNQEQQASAMGESATGVQNLDPGVQTLDPNPLKFVPRTQEVTLEKTSGNKLSNSKGIARDQNESNRRGVWGEDEARTPVDNSATPPRSELTAVGQVLARSRASLRERRVPSGATEPPRRRRVKVPPAVEAYIEQWSGIDFHDPEHVASNVSQAARLYRESGLSEAMFVARMYEARKTTLQHSGSIRKRATDSAGLHNRAPYFFACLKQLVTPAVAGVQEFSEPAPAAGLGARSVPESSSKPPVAQTPRRALPDGGTVAVPTLMQALIRQWLSGQAEQAQITPTIAEVGRLYRESKLSELDFVNLLHRARDLSQQQRYVSELRQQGRWSPTRAGIMVVALSELTAGHGSSGGKQAEISENSYM